MRGSQGLLCKAAAIFLVEIHGTIFLTLVEIYHLPTIDYARVMCFASICTAAVTTLSPRGILQFCVCKDSQI